MIYEGICIMIKKFDMQKNKFKSIGDSGSLTRSLMSEIKNGLKNQCVPLHLEYQPKVNDMGEVMGAEALLRWQHPRYGYISPLFITRICDEAGLTNELGRWVIKQAFGDLESLRKLKYDKISFSVNLSPKQLHEDEELIQVVSLCAKQLHMNPRYMELELMENATIDLGPSTQNKLKKIRDLGINISIDDFGMGHSSLLYLCKLYANVVKLDAALVQNVTKDGYYKQIVGAILSLCKQINVMVVAEGVETEDQLVILQELGCECFQGFYFSRSMTITKFIEYVNTKGCA
jgi:EAL domain-containing protein (putative c-di-GMP-specific phosphodiesterase class I)